MSSAWKPYAQALADVISGEIMDISSEFHEDCHILVHRCPDGRVLAFQDWFYDVYEFSDESAFQKALTMADEDYPFDVSQAIQKIHLE